MTTLLFTVFLKNISISLYSDELEANRTRARVYCLTDGIEDQWLGTLALVVFFPAF